MGRDHRCWRFWRTKTFLSIFATPQSLSFWHQQSFSGCPSFLFTAKGAFCRTYCGLTPVATDKLLLAAYNARRMQWADAALRDVDGNETDTPINVKATPPAALSTPSQSYVLNWPPGAPACNISLHIHKQLYASFQAFRT